MKLPIIYAEDRPTLHLLVDGFRKVGFSPHLVHLSSVQLLLERGKALVMLNGIPLKKFPLVFVREVRDYVNEMSLVSKACLSLGTAVIDSTFLLSLGSGGKLGLMSPHAIAKLPIPRTVFMQNGADTSFITRRISFPIVAKDNRGRHGKNIFLLRSHRDLSAFYRRRITVKKKTLDTKMFFFQEFIPAESDMRVLVLGDRVLGAVERKSTKKSEFRHNVARGGTTRQIPVTKEMEKLSLAASRLLNYEFAGVDLIRNRETGKLYILEVNRSPQFEGFMEATGIDVPKEVASFILNFLKKHIDLRASHGSPA